MKARRSRSSPSSGASSTRSHHLSSPAVLAALTALVLPAAGARAQAVTEAVAPGALVEMTEARLAAGASRVVWICERAADGPVGCRPAEDTATGVRFGDGRHGARLPVRAAAEAPEVASGVRIAPSRRGVLVMPSVTGATDAELTAIGRALGADPSSSVALARWRALAEREIRAGRDPTRLVPGLLDAALRTVGEDNDQLANVDLQSSLQRQQQALQTMSNLAKALHDTQMAVIRKLGG